MAERFVVTGAEGWLGQALLQRLLGDAGDAAASVRGLAWSAGGGVRVKSAFGALDLVVGDLRDAATAEALLGGQSGARLVHTVGVIHPRRVRDFYAVNVDATATLLRAAARHGLRRAVVVSSNSPCGYNADPDARFDENSPYAPYMHYGRSKMQMEQSARAIAAETGLELVIVRAPWFYGPHQPERQARFFRMIRDGRFPIIGDGLNRRSMAYTGTLAAGLVQAALSPAGPGQTYWMADARPYAMIEIVGTVERLLRDEFGQRCKGRQPRLPGLVADAARVADAALQSLGLYVPEIHVLSEMNLTIACSIDKAVRELGFAPQVDLEEGMRRSLRWMLAAGQAL